MCTVSTKCLSELENRPTFFALGGGMFQEGFLVWDNVAHLAHIGAFPPIKLVLMHETVERAHTAENAALRRPE